MTTHRAALVEPIEIAKFWKNRKGDAVIVQLREFEGHVVADARVNFTDNEGRLRPTKKGLSIAIARLPDLAGAINKALSKARELGLIAEKGGDHD